MSTQTLTTIRKLALLNAGQSVCCKMYGYVTIWLTSRADSDEYIVYPDVDGDEDVVYAYHGINE